MEIKVDKNQTIIRIDKFLINKLPLISRNKIQDAIEEGLILVNQKKVKSNFRIKADDKINFEDDFFIKKKNLELKAENINLKILYEDQDLAVINKPAGLVVHPGCGNMEKTLVNGLLYHFKENLPSKDPKISTRPGIIHRLDKDTSGIILIAKNDFAMTFLAKQFEDHSIDRSYICLVWNDIKEDKGTIENFLFKSALEKKVLCFKTCENKNYKKAITHFEVLSRYGFATLIKCKLETGRTHQIRSHMQSIGHPVFGDSLYGGKIFPNFNKISKFKSFLENAYQLMPHQALHSKSISFIHPRDKKKYFFDSDLAENFSKLINILDNLKKNNFDF